MGLAWGGTKVKTVATAISVVSGQCRVDAVFGLAIDDRNLEIRRPQHLTGAFRISTGWEETQFLGELSTGLQASKPPGDA